MLSSSQINRLVGAVSERHEVELMYVYGTPQKLYAALVRDAKAQDPPYLTRDPEALYDIACRNNWGSVRVTAMREP